MGISPHLLRVFMREHKLRPLTGRGLLLGRQSIFFEKDTLSRIAADENVPIKEVATTADKETRSGGHMTDYEMFAHFCDMEMDALDITPYEKANIIHDMNTPIGEEHYGKYDFLFDGSCMDNLFNPAEFIRNCARLLRPGGRLVAIEHGSAFAGGYIIYSPDWFLDFFALNKFHDAVVFTADFMGFKPPHHIESPWTLWNWNPRQRGEGTEHSLHLNPCGRLNLIIAEKGENSTNDKQPVQGQYRSSNELLENYDESYTRFLQSPRLEMYATKPVPDFTYTSASNLRFIGVL